MYIYIYIYVYIYIHISGLPGKKITIISIQINKNITYAIMSVPAPPPASRARAAHCCSKYY